MSALIIYMTRHGCTGKAVDMLARALPGSAVFDLGAVSNPPLDAHDTVAIGGSIHAGKVQKKLAKYCRDNIGALKSKRLGLFLCCMEEGEKAHLEFDQAFPAELREQRRGDGALRRGVRFREDELPRENDREKGGEDREERVEARRKGDRIIRGETERELRTEKEWP